MYRIFKREADNEHLMNLRIRDRTMLHAKKQAEIMKNRANERANTPTDVHNEKKKKKREKILPFRFLPYSVIESFSLSRDSPLYPFFLFFVFYPR